MSDNRATLFLEIAKLAPLLRWFGDPILRTPCQNISSQEISDFEIQELSLKLINVLKQVRQVAGIGRGLAAPQIGVTKRAIAIYRDEDYQVLINPQIIDISEERGIYQEMCLSGLPMSAMVIRPWTVRVEYQDIYGDSHTLLADPMLSRLLQHEIDHLNGILFTDKAEVSSISFISDFEEFKSQTQLVQI